MSSETWGIRPSVAAQLLVALIGLVLLALVPAYASAAGTGSISGTVTTDIGNEPVEGVCARAYDSAGEGLNYVSTGESDADGNYTVPELETGNYRVRFESCSANVLREWFDDESSFAEATAVSVTDGADTPDIDAQLAKGGSISGRVLNGAGGPDSGTCVATYNVDDPGFGFAQTDANGDYQVVGLETGQYRVDFQRCDSEENVAREFYPDKGSFDEAVPVAVTGGTDTPGIDAELEKGASISGTLKLTEGPPFVPSLCSSGVSVFNAGGDLVGSVSFGGGASIPPPSTGYMLNKLKGGNEYRLQASLSCFWSPSETFLSTEFFRDKESLAEATPISVGVGSAISGIDITLDAPDPDIPAPDTVIDSGPSGTVTSHDATFAFRSTDPGNTVGFECKIDSSEFADCASPKSFSSLSDGPHTFSVRAKHAVAGIEDQSPATRTFTVDTAVPPIRKARIAKVMVKGPAKVKRGERAAFKVRVTNSGTARATGVKLKVKGAGVNLARRAGTIAAGTSKTINVKVKPKRRGKAKLTFKVTSSNAGSASAKRRIVVKK